jgi:hypothetical protein
MNFQSTQSQCSLDIIKINALLFYLASYLLTGEPSANGASGAAAGGAEIESQILTGSGGALREKIVPEFQPVFEYIRPLMDIGGGKLIKLSDDSVWVVGIGKTHIDGNTGKQREQQLERAKVDARRAVVEALGTVMVRVKESSTDNVQIRVRNKDEESTVLSRLDTSVQTEVSRNVNRLETVGGWTSPDGSMMFVALGKKIQSGPSEQNEVKVMAVSAFEIASGLVTPEIASRFQASQQNTEEILKGILLATLKQELSSSKRMTLAVRGEALKRLQSEWLDSQNYGRGQSEAAGADHTVEEADFIATAKVEDLDASITNKIAGVSGSATRWVLRVTISLEIIDRINGKKRVLKEEMEETITKFVAQSERRSSPKGALSFDSGTLKTLAGGVSKKLGMRILDITCPPKIIDSRGRMFHVDRGRSAGMSVGMIIEICEPSDSKFGTDASYPIGKARVKQVSEETSLLELFEAEGESDLSKVEIKSSYSIIRPVDAPIATPVQKISGSNLRPF